MFDSEFVCDIERLSGSVLLPPTNSPLCKAETRGKKYNSWQHVPTTQQMEFKYLGLTFKACPPYLDSVLSAYSKLASDRSSKWLLKKFACEIETKQKVLRPGEHQRSLLSKPSQRTQQNTKLKYASPPPNVIGM